MKRKCFPHRGNQTTRQQFLTSYLCVSAVAMPESMSMPVPVAVGSVKFNKQVDMYNKIKYLQRSKQST